MTDEIVNGSPSRKLTLFDKRDLQRALAVNEQKRSDLARRFGVSRAYITQFAKRYALEIEKIREALDDEFAGLWIASKENRIIAYQSDYAMALGNEKRDHHEWIKARTGILHAVSEELGQLPPRQTVTVVPVVHVIEGVDLEVLK